MASRDSSTMLRLRTANPVHNFTGTQVSPRSNEVVFTPTGILVLDMSHNIVSAANRQAYFARADIQRLLLNQAAKLEPAYRKPFAKAAHQSMVQQVVFPSPPDAEVSNQVGVVLIHPQDDEWLGTLG